MISILDFFSDLTNPALAFLPKALLVSVMSALVCGVVGTHVVLRGMAFIGDAVAHAVFPGIAIAFVMQGSMLIGGAVAGLTIALMVAVFAQNRRIKEDTVIGIFFAAAFALGLVILSQIDGYTASLTSFLFGSITGVPDSDIILVAVVGTIVIAVLLLLSKELVTVSLDRETAQAQNLPIFWLDLVLYFCVTAAVVISVRTIGNVLVLALLVTPAATARLLTERLHVMMAISAAFGAVGYFLGLYLSWAINLPTGATIVLTVTAWFFLIWIFAPKQGILRRALQQLRPAVRSEEPATPGVANAPLQTATRR
ncbi:MAG: anchored repeat-type ABC transporter permease subunit [Actinomycetaceae bacterium]|nr:anchored repeat-type ABC transporter permease subunit [Actinomycetaceae bacterium]